MNTRSASDGMVWTTPTAASTIWPSRGRRAATMPSGSAQRIAATSNAAHRQLVVEALGLRLRQAVARGQAGPAVMPAQELVADADPQRPSGEVGDFSNAEAGRRRFAHGERVVVVEPQWPDEPDP